MSRPERGVGARRPGPLDPRRLRSEPRCARRPRRSISSSSTCRIRARRGGRRFARSRSSPTKGSSPASASRTSTATSSTRRSSSLRSQPCRSLSARSTIARFAVASSTAASRQGSPSSRTHRSAGRERAKALARLEPLAEVAAARDASAQEVALAWLLDLAPNVVAIPGARRPETARSSARAVSLRLEEPERERLRAELGGLRAPRAARRRDTSADVVVVMGVPGAGQDAPCRGVRRRVATSA